MIIKF
jgi:hypothetical protein